MNESMTYQDFAERVGAFADSLENAAIHLLDSLGGTSPEGYQVALIQYAAGWLQNLADQAVADAHRQSTGGDAS